MTAATIDDAIDTDELIDETTQTMDGPADLAPDNGNTPSSPAEISEANDARAKALRQLAGDDDDETDPKAGKGQFIPKGRFDEVNTRKNALEAQNAELIAALAAAASRSAIAAPRADPTPEPAFDMRAAYKARMQATLDGDEDAMLEIESKITAHNRAEARKEARADMEAQTGLLSARRQEESLKEAAVEMKAKYPQLDEKSSTADEDAISLVIVRRDKLMAAGIPAHKALTQAVDAVATRLGFDAPRQVASETDPVSARMLQARTRNAAAANQQPPDLGGKGDRATQAARIKVEEMTDEEFAAMPEAEKKRRRGDM